MPISVVAAVGWLPVVAAAALPATPGARDPHFQRLEDLRLLLLCVTFVGSTVALAGCALCIDDIVKGQRARIGCALVGGLRVIGPAFVVYVRYLIPLVVFGGIFVLGLAGIASGNPSYTVLGLVGVVVMAIPFGLTVLSIDVAIIHRVLRARYPQTAHFGAGVAAYSAEGSALAAIALLALDYTGYGSATLLMKLFPVSALVTTALYQVVGLAGAMVSYAFLTLFYLDLCRRYTGADLAGDAAAIRQETPVAL